MNVSAFGLIRLRASQRTIAPIILLPPVPMASLIIAGLPAYPSSAASEALLSQKGAEVVKVPKGQCFRGVRMGAGCPQFGKNIAFGLRLVDRCELHDFKTPLPGGCCNFNLVAFGSAHQPAANRR